MRHPALTEELTERAALYALGMLGPEQAEEFEHHLGDGCDVCCREAAAFIETAAYLPYMVEADPPPRIRERLAGRIAAGETGLQVWRAWTPVTSSGLHVVRAREGEWQNVCEGVIAKQLFVDTERDGVTMLIRMQPGATYPSHRHAGPEQCLVLEGDVEVNGLRFDAGDYQCMLTGSVHNITSTINGCLLLIVSSQHDQLLV